eukprot:2536739-Amphidinium_carterae.1
MVAWSRSRTPAVGIFGGHHPTGWHRGHRHSLASLVEVVERTRPPTARHSPSSAQAPGGPYRTAISWRPSPCTLV